ncbi:MAG: NAD(P)/FAD-dependent oxidoreductase [Acidobacteriota bacterium]
MVVGAGMAGLAAAQALHRAGRRVLVLEARERLGGRTFTADVGPATVDLGGAWIHGPRGNPIAKYARAEGFSYRYHELGFDTLYDAHSRSVLRGAAIDNIIEEFESSWWTDLKLAFTLGATASAADGIDAYLEELLEEDAPPQARRRARFTLEMLLSGIGAPLDRLSFEQLLTGDQEDLAGGDQVIQGGYGQLVQRLASDLDVRLGTPIARIEHDDRGVRLTSAQGEVFNATHALITVPLGVLKADSIAFSPALPEAKREAIQRLGYGFFEKVVLVFDRPHWRSTFGDNLLYLAGTGSERRFPYFLDMSEHSGAPTLVCLYSGAFAEHAQRTQSESQLIDATLSVLRQVHGDRLPDPVAAHATGWAGDPFSLGSYSYPALGSSSDDYRTLAQPVGRLRFAGEATTARWPQTVHGAFHSGLREAESLGADPDLLTS